PASVGRVNRHRPHRLGTGRYLQRRLIPHPTCPPLSIDRTPPYSGQSHIVEPGLRDEVVRTGNAMATASTGLQCRTEDAQLEDLRSPDGLDGSAAVKDYLVDPLRRES